MIGIGGVKWRYRGTFIKGRGGMRIEGSGLVCHCFWLLMVVGLKRRVWIVHSRGMAVEFKRTFCREERSMVSGSAFMYS